MNRIILYGAGNRCRQLIESLNAIGYDIYAVVDSNQSKWNSIIDGIIVQSPEILYHNRDAIVCVTFFSQKLNETIWEDLKNKYGLLHLVSFHELLLMAYSEWIDGYGIIKKDFCVSDKIYLDGSWHLNLGGVETWLVDTENYFRTYGINKSYLVTEKSNPRLSNINSDYIIDFSLIDNSYYSKDNIIKALSFLMIEVPDTIIFAKPDEMLLAACLINHKYGNKINIVMSVHNCIDGMYRDILSYDRYINSYLCVNSEICRYFEKHSTKTKSTYLLYIPVKYQCSLKRGYTLDHNKPLQIGYAGRLENEQKRVDLLLKVIKILEDHKVNFVMHIAGEGSRFLDIEKFIAGYNYDNIIMMGLIENDKMIEFWKEQDISINISDFEGRSLSNIEAMIAGAVPVVTDIPGNLEDVHDKKNGYVVPIGDYTSCAEKIEYIADNRECLKKMGQMAQKEIICKNNINDYIDMWKTVIYR